MYKDFEILGWIKKNNIKLEDIITLKGKLIVTLFDEYGKLKERHIFPNLTVTAGKTYTATWLSAASQATKFMEYLAVGTGTTAAAAGDTALQTEIGTRVAATVTNPSAGVTQRSGTFAAGNGTGAITEYGVLSALTGGTLWIRQVQSVVNKAAGDSMVVTHQMTIS